MSIQFGDILQHNNPNYPIADITNIKGGLRSIATFSDASLLSEFTSSTGVIPEKYKTGYSLMLERNTGTVYYLSGLSATNSSHWSPIGIGGNGTGIPFYIPKWIGSSTKPMDDFLVGFTSEETFIKCLSISLEMSKLSFNLY